MMNVEDLEKDQTMRENKKVMLKQLNEKCMTCVTKKVPLKGEGIVTPLFPPTCN
jgi:hypothetical protein